MLYYRQYKTSGGNMSDNKKEKNPFRERKNRWKKIREKPLSDKQINEINSILEMEIEDNDSSAPLEKVAQSIQKGDVNIWEY